MELAEAVSESTDQLCCRLQPVTQRPTECNACDCWEIPFSYRALHRYLSELSEICLVYGCLAKALPLCDFGFMCPAYSTMQSRSSHPALTKLTEEFSNSKYTGVPLGQI